MPHSGAGPVEPALCVGGYAVFEYDTRADQFAIRGRDVDLLALGFDPTTLRVSMADFLGRIDAESASVLQAALGAARRDGDVFDVTIASGEGDQRKWLAVRGRGGAPPADDEAATVVGTMRDVTTFKRLEAEHHGLVRTTQAILQTSSDVISIIDTEGVIQEIGTAAGSMFGTDPNGLVGSTVFTSPVVHPDDRDHVSDVYRRLLAGEIEHEESRYRVRTEDDHLRVVEGHRRVLRDPDGNVAGVVVIVTDVTAQVRLEDELREARSLAERADRAKDEFLSRMSHELRTPLNAVIGFGRILERDGLTIDQQECVGQILKAGELLLELINEVMDISRVASGKLSLSVEPVEVAEAIDEAVALIRPFAAGLDVAVSIDDQASTTAESVHARADRQRLKQVLLNLLSNAVKYNRRGGAVEIATRRVNDEQLRIEVRDTGIGISPERRERLFQPFDRLGAEQTDVQGTGLGLLLTKGLVEAMGGTLYVDSTEGVGTTFAVELAIAESQASRYEAAPAAAVPASPEAAGSSTVLYIEDNPSNLRLVERILATRPEFRLISATAGRVGLTMAREHSPNVVLLDLHLPDIMGDEVLMRLRSEPETSSIPVVVLSADATPGSVQRLLEDGAAEYLTKPLDIDRLLGVLDRLCAVNE